MSTPVNCPGGFSDLGLSAPVMRALNDVGYETPSPIQEGIIPLVLAGRDVVGQAQTGTGKTAAFALPLLSRIDINHAVPQVLVLTPTRELAIQVAEAFQRYAAHLGKFNVLPIYGGQEYTIQLRQLKRGAHVIVGTPGRVMDHIRRGTLKLQNLDCLVLDEADEMLRMGFIDDVEWILEKTPEQRQVALFSATMPPEIRKIAKRYLRNPGQVTVKLRTATAETINQQFIPVNASQKLDALTRILESITFNGVLIFVRTRVETVDLADKLSARGYACTALNGDMAQKTREQTVNKLKAGKLDILVATDVAARGLDVERISHVINYDMPNDPEAYVHRIGRTGRAGRSGEAILFVTPRERHMLQVIEKAVRHRINLMRLPSAESINNNRISSFKQQISNTIASGDLGLYTRIIEEFQQESQVDMVAIAAALAKLSQGDKALLLEKDLFRKKQDKAPVKNVGSVKQRPGQDKQTPSKENMERYRLEVGSKHDAKAGHIVGAIANEAGLDGHHIRKVTIYEDYSTVDLPVGMPKDIFQDLRKVRVAGYPLNISKQGDLRPGNKQKKNSRKKNTGNTGRSKKSANFRQTDPGRL